MGRGTLLDKGLGVVLHHLCQDPGRQLMAEKQRENLRRLGSSNLLLNLSTGSLLLVSLYTTSLANAGAKREATQASCSPLREASADLSNEGPWRKLSAWPWSVPKA